MEKINLVIFTCEGREHLLKKTYESFLENCDYSFNKIILAIDGQIDPNVIPYINPSIIIQSYQRKGYVNNIINALSIINSPLFFWLEDDWEFHQKIDIKNLTNQLIQHIDWSEIILSKSGPLTAEQKIAPLGNNFYKSIYGFSANPCLCNSSHIKEAFKLLEHSEKGNKLGEDGFENFLTNTFENENKIVAILDPIDRQQITHEGYLESTPRSWHMTNSIDKISYEHLLILPVPSFTRRGYMIIKLFRTFLEIGSKQLFNNKIYEYCFRVVTGYSSIKKDELK